MSRSVPEWIAKHDDQAIPPRVKDLRRKNFGFLHVRAFDGYTKNGLNKVAAWKCTCECGLERRASGVELSRGRIVSCGCKSVTARKDIHGVRFGYWTALWLDNDPEAIRTKWVCECRCGVIRSVQTIHLTSGASQSCGCDIANGIESSRYKHGSNPELYGIWCNMIQRCENPNSPAFHNYGGRGINICAEWHEFSAFEQDMGQRPSPKHTLEREDNNGNYGPRNCKWATRKEQARNSRRNIIVDLSGRKVSLAQACEETGINYDAAKYRFHAGYDWRGI